MPTCKIYALWFILLLFGEGAKAQLYFLEADSIPVSVFGVPISNPWGGGLTSGQISSIDLNMDGIKDLFVFDRSNARIQTFINKGTPGAVAYVPDRELPSHFPVLWEWALCVDYNCDGKEDIFAYAHQTGGGGIEIYKNVSNPVDGLKFEIVDSLLYAKYYDTKLYNLFVSSIDIPAILDMDKDGDLDIITFGNSSQSLEYHKNMSMEKYGVCDSLNKYELQTACWGKFAENIANNSLSFNQDCAFYGNPNPSGGKQQKTEKHTGSCEFCIDIDGDNDQDMVIGDVSNNNLVLAVNGGDSVNAKMIGDDPKFPKNNGGTDSVNLTIFPCGYSVDVNNDGLKDMLVTPNSPNYSENYDCVLYYKNTGTLKIPAYQFVQKNFLIDQMIDVGDGCYPTFFDIDGDGKLDLIVGNYGYYTSSILAPKLSYYRNIGTTTQPHFDLYTKDFDNLSVKLAGPSLMAPAFGDLDNDGDGDLIVGNAGGQLSYLINTAGPTAVATYSVVTKQLRNKNGRIIDLGNVAFPQLIDVNLDGKKDLLVGMEVGQIAYYMNVGTVNNPVWDSVTTKWGNVDVAIPCCGGNAAPCLYNDSGSFKLFVGSDWGTLFYYTNLDGNINGSFIKADTAYNNIFEGERINPSMADINGDGYVDLAIGNYSGGLRIYYGQKPNGIPEMHAQANVDFLIYPNPAEDQFTLSADQSLSWALLKINDISGKEISSQTFSGRTIQVDVAHLAAGMYFVQLLDLRRGASLGIKKLIVH